eukprot:4159802-Pyramimonas_sp.AAC.1
MARGDIEYAGFASIAQTPPEGARVGAFRWRQSGRRGALQPGDYVARTGARPLQCLVRRQAPAEA